IAFAPALRSNLPTLKPRSFPVQGGLFLVREELFVCILSGSLQGRLILVSPDTLQVGLAPFGFGRWARLGRGTSLGAGRGGLARHGRQREQDDGGYGHYARQHE